MRRREHLPFILPSIIVLVVITIFPMLFLYYVSLTNLDLTYGWHDLRFVGIANYLYLFTIDPNFLHAIYVSLAFTFVAVAIETGLGTLIALLFNRYRKLKPLLIPLLIIPMVVTPSIISLIWKLMLNSEYGVVNYLLSLFRIGPVNWLGSSTSLVSLTLVEVWQWTPFMTLMIYAGLQALPSEPLERQAWMVPPRFKSSSVSCFPLFNRSFQ